MTGQVECHENPFRAEYKPGNLEGSRQFQSLEEEDCQETRWLKYRW